MQRPKGQKLALLGGLATLAVLCVSAGYRAVKCRHIVRTALLALAPGLPTAAEEAAESPQTRVIELESGVLEFAPSRDDLSVRVAVINLLGATNLRVNDKETKSQWKSIELEEVGTNRFRLPALEIEFSEGDRGYLCMSVKVWFDKLANEFDSLFYEDRDDRYALLSYCTEHADADRATRARFGQNRVETLEEFRKTLTKPFTIRLSPRRIPSPGIAVDRDGTLFALCYLPDRPLAERNQLWKIGTDGTKTRTPLLGRRTASWRGTPHSPAIGGDGTLYLSGLLRVSETGEVSRLPYPFEEPVPAYEAPVAADAEGNLYFGSITRHGDDVRRIQLARLDPDGEVEVVAGSIEGHRDGEPEDARFIEITAIAVGPSGDVYAADGRWKEGSWIRRIGRDRKVTTLAGSDELGYLDGKGAAARFRVVSSLSVDAEGNIYVADRFNRAIRKVAPGGEVSTIAGQGMSKETESLARDISLADPAGVAVGPDGDVFVLDGRRKEARVRRISRDGQIRTVAVLR